MGREDAVQAHRTFRLAITIPAANGTHISLAAAILAAQTALTTPFETAVSSPLVTAKTFAAANVIGFEVSGYLPAVVTQRPAIFIADGLSAAATIDTTRAEYVPAGLSKAPPAINDVNGIFLCAAVNSPITALVTFAVVVRGF